MPDEFVVTPTATTLPSLMAVTPSSRETSLGVVMLLQLVASHCSAAKLTAQMSLAEMAAIPARLRVVRDFGSGLGTTLAWIHMQGKNDYQSSRRFYRKPPGFPPFLHRIGYVLQKTEGVQQRGYPMIHQSCIDRSIIVASWKICVFWSSPIESITINPPGSLRGWTPLELRVYLTLWQCMPKHK
jgi:hypothetical protein